MKPKPLILVSLLLAAFVINLDTTIVNVALPSLVRQLHASNSQLQWVVDAFNLLFAGSILSDRFGRKGMLLAGLSVFGLASLAGGLMDSAGALIAARSVMGVGAAMVFPSTLSLLTNVFTERGERARAIGLWGGSRARRSRSDRSLAAGCSRCPIGASSSLRWRRSPPSPVS
jgi:MFS family permease